MIDVPRHSTRVRLTFSVNDRDYDIAQVGPDIIMFRDRAELPPCRGRLTISVDDDDRIKVVTLPDGVRPGDRFVRMERETNGADDAAHSGSDSSSGSAS